METKTIGVFDSGVGGLTVLKALREAMPSYNYIYLGDTANMPYGNKTLSQVKKLALNTTRFLLNRGCDAIVVACNTSTAAALTDIKKICGKKPVYGMFDGAIEALKQARKGVRKTTFEPVGVCATCATIKSKAYEKALKEEGYTKIYTSGSLNFTRLIEAGNINGKEIDEEINNVLTPLKDKNIKSFIFGCTHYPFIKEEISKFFGDDVKLIDPATGLASLISKKMKYSKSESKGRVIFYTSGDINKFKEQLSILWSKEEEFVFNPHKQLLVATGNKGKLKEIKELLDDVDVDVISLKELPYEIEPEETGETFSENALIKAMVSYIYTGLPTIADDSGLCVDALNGAPGVYSARYSGADGNDELNNQLLLKNLENVPDKKRSARFRCDCIFVDGKGIIHEKTGTMEGYINHGAKGVNGFGYDPLFIVKGLNKTSAEISSDEKNSLSHRGQALRKLKPTIKKYFNN